MPSRQWHTKTRHACGQCKKRRIRCSLTRPTCAGCLQRRTCCDFSLDQSLGPSDHAEPNAAHISNGYTSINGYHYYLFAIPQDQPYREIVVGTPNTADYLSTLSPSMHTWLLPPTHPGMLLRFSDLSPSWETHYPIIGTLMDNVRSYDFLQYSFRALAILYEARGGVLPHEKRMVVLGDHIKASELFRTSPVGAKAASPGRSWVAALAFSMTVVIFQLRMAAASPPPGGDTALEIMTALRFAARLARSAAPSFVHERDREFQQSKKAAQHLMANQLKSQAVKPEDKIASCFQAIEQSLEEVNLGESTVSTVRGALHYLRLWMDEVQGYPHTWMHLASWPASVSQEYIDLIASGDPIAMALLVPWSVVISRGPSSWHTCGWPTLLQRQATSQMNKRLRAALGILFAEEMLNVDVYEMVQTGGLVVA